MSTPPRIRGLVDRLEHAVRMQMYAKREDKKQRKQEVLQAKMVLLRAFALLSQPSAQQSAQDVSVPRELLERVAGIRARSCLIAMDELRTLLNGGEA